MELTDQLQWISDSAQALLPELILAGGIFLLILLNILKIEKLVYYNVVSLIVITATCFFVISLWPVQPHNLFNNMLRADDFSASFKLLFLAGTTLTVLMGSSSNQTHPAEYFSLLLTVTLGAHLLVMSTNFIMVILSLELISISSYVLAGFGFTKTSTEGSLKYFLFGSAATAIMIYGLSLLFGFTGTLHFASDAFANRLAAQQTPLLLLSVFFILAGFLFKSTAVPFHLWVPDVYEAAPMPIVAFFSTVPKLAGVAALLKFTLAIHPSSFDWQNYIAVISMLSILVGNLSALWQNNVKRMMAYSSIAQAGFLIAAFVPLTAESVQFLLFYSSVFLVMNFLVFLILLYFENTEGTISIKNFSGLGSTQVFLAILLFIGFISLTGLPPTAGFTAKLFVFSSIWKVYQDTGKNPMLWLLIIGLINTVISLFFYLKIPYYLFIKEKEPSNRSPAKVFSYLNLLALILVIVLLLLFFYPALLMSWTNKVNFVL